MDSRTYMTCGLKVNVTSNGWYKCLTKVLKKIAGASYVIDAEAGMAYISGKVNAKKLLKRIAEAGKKDAEICWVKTGDGYYNRSGYHGNWYFDYKSLSYDPFLNHSYRGSYCFPSHSYYSPYNHHDPVIHYYPQLPLYNSYY